MADSGTIPVPDVVGFTELAAEATLKNANLVVGKVTTASSNTVPARGVSSTSPAAGTLVSPDSAIDLEVSTGQKFSWTSVLTFFVTPAFIFAILGIIVLGLIVYGVYGNEGFLTSLANKEVARGLITFLIAITTVGIAVILALSTIIPKGDADDDKRFDRGKQVLTMLIGVLGTIVGFYFGSDVKPIPLAITTVTLPAGTANKTYPSTTLQSKGGTPPLKWSVKPTLPAKLELDPVTGTISGTPTIASSEAKFAFTVTDSATPAASSTADLTLEIKSSVSSATPSPTPSATP